MPKEVLEAPNLTGAVLPVGLDIESLRRDFPALSRRVGDYPLCYFDNTAGTLKPRQVIDALADYYSQRSANVHRGIHLLSEESTEAFEAARGKLARFINARQAAEIVFVRNTTEALNLVAGTFGRSLKPGDEILCTASEHHSNLVSWQHVRDVTGATLLFAKVLPSGGVDLDDWHSKLSERTRLAAFAMVSNVSGYENPVAAMTAAAHAVGAKVMLDAAQGVPHMPVDVQALGVDFLACSAYKMLAPFGIGALYGRYEELCQLPPYQFGGGIIQYVTLEKSEFALPPARFEAGTPAVGEAVGWGAALDYLSAIGMENFQAREIALSRYLHERLLDVPGLRLLGDYYHGKPAIASFALDYAHAHDVAQFLNEEGVAVRAGLHCAEPLHQALGFDATVRASLYVYNTEAEVDQLISALGTVREILG